MRILVAIAIVFISACASSHIIVGNQRKPIDPSLVKIYISPPPVKYEEIAIVEASSKRSFSFSDQGRIDSVIKRLKEEAAALGANGIILHGVESQTGAAVTAGTATGYGGTAYGTGIAVPVMIKSGQGTAIYISE